MKKTLSVVALLAALQSAGLAETQSAYDKEQLKKDYRAFLQQLKQLNAQYKEITGEIGQVMKEEGAPSWDMGESAKLVEGDKQTQMQDLEGGAYLKDSPKEMVLTVDLPGYKKDSIKLSFKDNKTLQITAQRKLDTVSRSFERSFDLPVPGDQKNSQATYTDGVLTVKIPKIASQEISIPVR